MGFADFKAKMKSNNQLDKIKSKIEEETKSYDDERYFKFEVDASGNGYVVLRFLPEAEGEDFPYVTYYEHSWKNEKTGKWYIERSRTSLGKGTPDPVSEANTLLWNSGIESNKQLARKRGRRQRYVSNVLILKDSRNPQNEGKVMLWKYGKKIWEKINSAMNPPAEFEDEVPMNPFHMWEGADFRLKAEVGDNGFRSYDKSNFAKPAPLYDGDDEKLEEVYNSLHKLQPEVADENYKSYDDLKKRFELVEGISKPAAPSQEENQADTPQQVDNTESSNTTNSNDADEEDYLSMLD